MEIVELLSENQIQSLLTNYANDKKLFVIDCGATWCNPCKIFSQFYHKFVKNHPITNEIIYCELNIDNFPQFCKINDISTVPTILFVKKSQILDKIVGASTIKFKNTLNQYTESKKLQTYLSNNNDFLTTNNIK